MPVVGENHAAIPASGFSYDGTRAMANSFLNVAKSILTECGQNVFDVKNQFAIYSNPILENSMKDLFIENCYDEQDETLSAEQKADKVAMQEQLYENDKKAILEHAPMLQYNPVIGMTFPIHKNIMLNNVFDQVMPKYVATSPKFTISMETRWLIDPVTGEKIDMWKQQYKMTDAILKAAPLKSMYLALPENKTTNILQEMFGVNGIDDHLSIESYISGLVGSRVCFPGQTIRIVTSTTSGGTTTTNIETYTNTSASAEVIKSGVTPAGTIIGDTVVGAIFDWDGKFAPAYGENDRQICDNFTLPIVTAVAAGTLADTWKLTAADGTVIDNCTSEENIPLANRATGFVSGFSKDDRFGINSSNTTAVAGCIFTSRIDTSSAKLNTARVSWDVRNDIIEIPNAIPINVTIAPEEIKDINALYQINQLTKVMSLIKISLGNYKDDLERRYLDDSFLRLDNMSKIARSFDFAPPLNYALDPIEWRYKTFMDSLDTHVTQLLHVLNDPNMTISIIGRDDLIRKISPTEYTYQTPSNIGPVELDFVKTVVTSDKRTYQFISSDKLRDTNNLTIMLNPRNTDRFIYRVYDYQMYISNEIRNNSNPLLPSIHAFERWIMKEYQPVQGRLRILNPTGLRNYGSNYSFNNDPVGRGDGMGVASVGKNDFDIDAR